MRIFLIISLIGLSVVAEAQSKIDSIVNAEYRLGHFNGSVLVVKDGKILNSIYKGSANFQFEVPITAETRFPIASVSKLFTSIMLLQLRERSAIKFDDSVGKYIPGLPAGCGKITLDQLLTHHSGLKNEPIAAYLSAYSVNEYIKKFVMLRQAKDTFNYNNVDFVLLSGVIEVVTKKSYGHVLQEQILTPLGMSNTGLVDESLVIPRLAYGYHNYSFGSGKPGDTLYNDSRFISNYAGAGAIYSTTTDLYKLLAALKTNKLMPASTHDRFLTRPQKNSFNDYFGGSPSYGFYVNEKAAIPQLRRSGNIDGFNSVLLMSKDFSRIVIILANTDTGDIEKLADKLFKEIN